MKHHHRIFCLRRPFGLHGRRSFLRAPVELFRAVSRVDVCVTPNLSAPRVSTKYVCRSFSLSSFERLSAGGALDRRGPVPATAATNRLNQQHSSLCNWLATSANDHHDDENEALLLAGPCRHFGWRLRSGGVPRLGTCGRSNSVLVMQANNNSFSSDSVFGSLSHVIHRHHPTLSSGRPQSPPMRQRRIKNGSRNYP